MPDALDSEIYLAQLEHELEKMAVPPHRRDDMIHEVSSLLADGTPLASLGSPETFARELEDALHGDTAENPELPIDFSGIFASKARRRIWDPENPRIFVPRTIGAGWDINMGALAVKLGILNPDDIDDDVLAAIPQPLVTAARLTPLVFAGVSATALWKARKTGKRLAMNTTFTGTITKYWGPRSGIVAHAVIPAIAALWAAMPNPARRDILNKSALASMLNSAIAGSAISSLTAKNGKVSALALAALAAALPFACEFAVVAVPVRYGRRLVTRSRS